MLYYLTAKEKVREVVFKYDKSRDTNYGFDKNSKATNLSKAELADINELIKARVAIYNRNKDPKDRYEFIRKPEKYFKQLIPVIDSKGEKEVWVACHCVVMKDYWTKSMGMVNDGGICELALKINLTKRTVLLFRTHGLA